MLLTRIGHFECDSCPWQGAHLRALLEHWEAEHGVYWFMDKVESQPKSVAPSHWDIREAAAKYHPEETP